MKVLVTGGAGYLGSALVPLLLDNGHSVIVFDLLKNGAAPILPFFRRPGFSFVRGDIRSCMTLSNAAAEADVLVHLAAVVGYPACAGSPLEAEEINVAGTRNVVSVAGRDRPVVFASTSSCYGRVLGDLCTEDTPLRPLSVYGRTKAQAEKIVLESSNSIVCRIATTYGVSPRMRLDLLVNDFVHRALHERRLRVYQGHFRRSFIHVSDAARALAFAVEKLEKMAESIYNIGDQRQNYTKLEVCERIARLLPGVRIETCQQGEDADQRNYAVSYDRIESHGFRAQVSLEEGICELRSALQWIERNEL